MKTCVLLLFCASLLVLGCGSAPSEKAVKAAEVADAIAAEPDRADAVLSEHGMTLDEFETLLYEIAEDPELTKEYESLRKVADPR